MLPSRRGLSYQVSPTLLRQDRSTSGPSEMPSAPGDDLATCFEDYCSALYCDDDVISHAKDKYMTALCCRLLDFLDQFYSSDRGTGNYHLKIPFEMVLSYDFDLAYGICSLHQTDSLSERVDPIVIGFLTGENSEENISEIMKKGEPVTFDKMPNRIARVSDLPRADAPLIRIKPIIDGTIKVCVASDFGLWLIHGFLEEVFNWHKRGQTWKGEFNASDMVLISSAQFRIIKRPEYGASDYRKDLEKILEIFMPYFTSEEGMPLFFDELQLDLGNDNIDVEDESFRGFILSHVALKSSLERLKLLHTLHLALGYCGANDLEIPSDLAAIPDARTQGWLCPSGKERNDKKDWRNLIPNDKTDVLYRAFWHNRDPDDGGPLPFGPTTKELLRYMRNVIEHGHEYVKQTDAIELEQYLAKKFHQYLPYILRKLWKDPRMFIDGPFAPYLKAYRDSIILTDPRKGLDSFS